MSELHDHLAETLDRYHATWRAWHAQRTAHAEQITATPSDEAVEVEADPTHTLDTIRPQPLHLVRDDDVSPE